MTPLTLEPAFRAAPTILRLFAGLLDLAIEAALGAALTWWWLPAEEWPPRYWNLGDYAVDIVWQHPDLAVRAVLPFLAVFLFWEVFWGRLLGNAPVARLLGTTIVTRQGRRPGVVRLAVRTVIGLLGALLAFSGPLFALVHPRRRMLHDMMTGCHVLIGRAPRVADEPPDDADALIVRDGYRDGPFR